MNFILTPGKLTYADLKTLLNENTTLSLPTSCQEAIIASEKTVRKIIADKKVAYGINTGFGLLANTRIDSKDLDTLQRSLVLSHATGTGELLSDDAVRLILALKINSLARGFSGVNAHTIHALIRLYNAKVYPCIPSKGSVGASGDLAPLAHLSAVLLGVGHARYQGKIISAKKALEKAGITPLHLQAKEGLALLNGTQVSTALAILGLFAAETVFVGAITAGALSVDAMKASHVPFDERIHEVRGQPGQIKVATYLRTLLKGSHIATSHRNCDKVQDPYSLRCQPQVMGAALTQLLHNGETLLIEANAVSDNPLVFANSGDILSGGNFHAEPVAMAADNIAIAIAEMASLSERRIALLIDPRFSGLPAFLVNDPGINSGFMIAQVTAAALVSENKTLAHPASVDSIPTSANQEDHVSMATFAGRRLLPMAENAATVIAIELLAACQGIDFLRPLKTSATLEKVHRLVRKHVAFYAKDRYFAPDIQAIIRLVQSQELQHETGISLFASSDTL